MTKKDVIISIRGRQFFLDLNDDEPMELVTSGELSHSGGGYILTYREHGLPGMDDTITTLMIDLERITLLRSGSISTQMVFEEGRKHLSFYDTDEGALLIGVQAKKVRAVMNDFGGDIEMEYLVEIDHAVSGANQVSITVKEAGGKKPPEPQYYGIVHDGFIN